MILCKEETIQAQNILKQIDQYMKKYKHTYQDLYQ